MERILGLTRLEVFRAAPTASAAGPAVEAEFAWLDRGAVLALCDDPGFDIEAGFAEAALARGHRCLAARCGGRVAGYLWVASGCAPHVARIMVAIPAGAQYRFKLFVLPELRGRGIATALYREADLRLRGEGGAQALVCISPHNRASQHCARAAGAARIGTVTLWQAGPLFIALHSRGVRVAGLRFHLAKPGAAA